MSLYALVLWGGITHRGIRRTTVVCGRWHGGDFVGKRVNRKNPRETAWKHARAFPYANVLMTFDYPPTQSDINRVRRAQWFCIEGPRHRNPGHYHA